MSSEKQIEDMIETLVDKVSQIDIELANQLFDKCKAAYRANLNVGELKPQFTNALVNLISEVHKGSLTTSDYMHHLRQLQNMGQNTLAMCFNLKFNQGLKNAEDKKLHKALEEPLKKELKEIVREDKAEAREEQKRARDQKKAEAKLERQYRRQGHRPM